MHGGLFSFGTCGTYSAAYSAARAWGAGVCGVGNDTTHYEFVSCMDANDLLKEGMPMKRGAV